MSNEEINRKIAEACGWRNVRMTKGRPFWGDDEGQLKYNALGGSPPGEALDYVEEIPDYCSDLNACHEMENALTDDERLDYIDNLLRIQSHEKSLPVALTFAPAAQRAEAFLKTVAPKL